MRRLRSDESRHLLAFHAWRTFDLAYFGELLDHHFENLASFLDVLHLSASETNADAHLIVVLQELVGLAELNINIVLTGDRADTDFFLLLLMRFGGLGCFLRLFKAELAVIHDAANGRTFRGGYLHEVEPKVAGLFQGLRRRKNAKLFSFCAYHTNRTQTNLFVDAGASILRRGTGGFAENP